MAANDTEALRALVDTGLELSFAMIDIDLTNYPEVADRLAAFRDVLADARDLPISRAPLTPAAPVMVAPPPAVEEVVRQMRFMAELGIPVKAENVGRWAAALTAPLNPSEARDAG